MKASRYNFFFKEEGLLFNAVTCGLAQVLPENIDLIEKILNDPNTDNLSSLDPDFKEKLIEGGFLIEDDVEELNLLKTRYNLNKFASGSLFLTIAPTLDCNFNCPYCYEKKQKNTWNKSIINSILAFIYSQECKRVGITWYGGEPLLELDNILTFSEEVIRFCAERKISYNAEMITNGYLLTPQTTKVLKERANLRSVQITLDGPPEIHNARRSTIGDQKTFDKILDNIFEAAQAFRINIRVNIDKTNYPKVFNLFPILANLKLQNKITISPGFVGARTIACKHYEKNCFTISRFASVEIEFNRLLKKFGFTPGHYPGSIFLPCGLLSPFAFVIGPSGELYKCWESVGIPEEVTGNIEQPGKLTPLLSEWLNYEPFKFNKCQKCPFLPICMGGCPRQAIKNEKPECILWRYNLSDLLHLVAEIKKEVKRDGMVSRTLY